MRWAVVAMAVLLCGCAQIDALIDKLEPIPVSPSTENGNTSTGGATTPSTGTPTTNTPTTSPTNETPVTSEYVVAEDQRVERKVAVPMTLEFTISGKEPSVEDGSAKDNMHMCWCYEKDWGGGNVSEGGGMVVGVRDYAIKVYDKDGKYAGQVRYDGAWRTDRSYTVKLSVEQDVVRWYINGNEVARQDAAAPDELTCGYGWPPSRRPGPLGAKITNVKWGGDK